MISRKSHMVCFCIALLTVSLLCCGFWGKTKKDIDVKGITSVAVLPFYYAHFKDFSERSGDIVAEQMMDIFKDRCEWQIVELEKIREAMKELDVDEKTLISKVQAVKVGKQLGVDLVVFGELPMYDEHESSREIFEKGGGTENIRELKVEYNIKFMKISDGTLIKEVKTDQIERDTARDPMMPAPPEKQLKNGTRSMTKKLVKRFIMK